MFYLNQIANALCSLLSKEMVSIGLVQLNKLSLAYKRIKVLNLYPTSVVWRMMQQEENDGKEEFVSYPPHVCTSFYLRLQPRYMKRSQIKKLFKAFEQIRVEYVLVWTKEGKERGDEVLEFLHLQILWAGKWKPTVFFNLPLVPVVNKKSHKQFHMHNSYTLFSDY